MIMKKLAKISALLFAVVLIATGCKKLPEFTDGSGSTPTPVTPVLDEPTVITKAVVSVGTTDAVCGGSVEYSGYYELTAVGFCWSEKAEPTIEDHYSIEATSAGSFVGKINNLTPSTTYYVRTYATNANGTYYGNVLGFTTLESGGGEAPTGAINGLFSLGNSQYIYFSKGNLQFQASTNTWRFAENQYEIIGNDNANIGSSSYTGWIDLFGWGTGNNPTNSSVSSHDYEDFTDWGNNAISNGGNTTNTWHSLTQDEWVMILFYRNTDSGLRFAKANVNGINGLILLPDNWSTNTYYLYNTNTANAAYSSNTIGLSNWSLLEEAGAVFLPAAGTRSGTTISNVESDGEYWTSSFFQAGDAIDIYISDSSAETMVRGLSDGCSVRLVHDAN